MTGAEKTLKWFNDYTKINGVYPLVAEIEAQLSMAVDEERLNKAENLPISDVSSDALIHRLQKADEVIQDLQKRLEKYEGIGC